MKPQVLKHDLLKQLIPVAVAAVVVAVALTAPAVAAKGGKGQNTSSNTTTLALASERIYWPDAWEPNCMTEDDIDQRNFTGSLFGSYSTTFRHFNQSTDGWTSGGEGVQSRVAVSGTVSDFSITDPNGAITHAVFTGQSRGLSYYEVCVVPPYYAATDTGTSPLSGGAYTITLAGSISSVSWTAQVTMTDANFQQQNCPTSQQRIIP
jgi:hypothetical protein